MMNINATLFGQMITFAVFVWFTMKYVWPYLSQAMADREKKIADGLAAAEKGKRELERAEHRAVEIIQAAKVDASRMVEQAQKRGVRIIEDAKEDARQEGQRLIESAKGDIEQQMNQAKRELQNQAADLALVVAEKILQRDIDAKTHQKLLDNMVGELH